MSVVVNTNTQSIFAQRAVQMSTNSLQKNIENLSTGFRINRAADDAAGLSISEKLTTNIKGTEKAKQNIGDGISLMNTMEAGLAFNQENVQRIRELFVQGLNGTNSANELNSIQNEINERIRNIRDIFVNTIFNGNQLLANHPDIILQTGPDASDTFTIQIAQNTGGVVPPVPPNTGIDPNPDWIIQPAAAANAGQLAEGASVGFQFSSLRLPGATVPAENGFMGGAHGTLDDLDATINSLSRMRSYLGASINALESKLEYLDIAGENAQASRSRIRDVNVAKESSDLVKNQILQQSSAAMLQQANQTTNIALDLLP
jgi:flagellin